MEDRTLDLLKAIKPIVTDNTYKTIKGQIKKGEEMAAVKGMENILRRESRRTRTE